MTEPGEDALEAARASGIVAFPGFEVVTRDGCGFVCLFEPDKPLRTLERYLGEFGVLEGKRATRAEAADVLARVKEWSGVALLTEGSPEGDGLMAVVSPGPAWSAPGRPVARVPARPVESAEDLQGAHCQIKMSNLTIEGLRQAFLDPESRIQPEPQTAPSEITAIAWDGGFLDGSAIQFNPSMNVLIGGRGAGKSTVLESIRFALGLQPISDEARKIHDGVVARVLGTGTRVSLLLRSEPPNQEYVVERTVGGLATVRTLKGEQVHLTPLDLLPHIEAYGQHELAELARRPDKLTLLLKRFTRMESDRSNLAEQLAESRDRILALRKTIQGLRDKLSELPQLEELLKRYQQAGLEERFKEKTMLVREEHLFNLIPERLAPVRQLSALLKELRIDCQFLSPGGDLPDGDLLEKQKEALEALNSELARMDKSLNQALAIAHEKNTALRAEWEERRQSAEENYERLLRELQKSRIDGAEFIELQRKIEALRPLHQQLAAREAELATLANQRAELLRRWEEAKAAEFRGLNAAAKAVSQKLQGRVRVEVAVAGNRDPLENLLREEVGGNLAAAVQRLRALENLSVLELAERLRSGKAALMDSFHLPSAAAERLAAGGEKLAMQIEELELPTTASIQLNVGKGEVGWKPLEQLSTGQKATAVLLLVLLDSPAPLLIDQPEDDLDNRFVTESVVPILRREKHRRQFILTTHNANLPVLGDAELIARLTASGESQATITENHLGSIDTPSVRTEVEEILEGGKTAFEERRLKYGF